jgi:hypothetical protein
MGSHVIRKTRGVLSELTKTSKKSFMLRWKKINLESGSEGLKFCQFSKNSAYHAGIKQPLYEAMIGKKVSFGLKM